MTAGERLAAVLAAAMKNRCPHCLRMRATQEDWDRYDDGEGEHLCWEEPHTCGWVPEVTAESLLAAAVLDHLAAELGSGKVETAVAEAVWAAPRNGTSWDVAKVRADAALGAVRAALGVSEA